MEKVITVSHINIATEREAPRVAYKVSVDVDGKTLSTDEYEYVDTPQVKSATAALLSAILSALSATVGTTANPATVRTTADVARAEAQARANDHAANVARVERENAARGKPGNPPPPPDKLPERAPGENVNKGSNQ